MRPPLFSADPKAAYLAAREEIDAAIQRVLASGRYILGPEVESFEREFAAYLGAGGCVGVANGTDALELALRALGVGPGDRVATVANSVSATASAIVATGATPVFVEIDPGTLLMDPAALERTLALSPGIKAVIPVHLYGQPCAMPEILEIARRHGASVVEDCAQSHGAAVGSRKVGTWGDLAAFSFYPTKNLAALGDGGAVTGRDAALLERVRLLRQYGWRTRYVSDLPGRNSRLDELQAAILRVQLPRLDAANAHRAKLAASYMELLGGVAHPGGVRSGLPTTESTPPGCSTPMPQSVGSTPTPQPVGSTPMPPARRDVALHGLSLPVVPAGRTRVWHQFVVRSPQREALRVHLEKAGIHCGVLYPVPLHRQGGFSGAGRLVPGGFAAVRPGSAAGQSRVQPASDTPTTNNPKNDNLPSFSLPHTERACAEVLSLPLHPGITEGDVERVCAALGSWAKGET